MGTAERRWERRTESRYHGMRKLTAASQGRRGQQQITPQSCTVYKGWSGAMVRRYDEASHRSFSRSDSAAAKRSSAMRRRLFSAASRPTSSSLPSITSATVAGPALRSDACSTRVLARAVPDLAKGPGGGGVSFISSCTASCTAPCCEPCTCTCACQLASFTRRKSFTRGEFSWKS